MLVMAPASANLRGWQNGCAELLLLLLHVFVHRFLRLRSAYTPSLLVNLQTQVASIRHLAYTSDLGEAFRPVVPNWAVNATYGIAVGTFCGVRDVLPSFDLCDLPWGQFSRDKGLFFIFLL